MQEAKTAREIQSLEDENTELYIQSVPIAQRASAGANGARHHNNFLQNQIADNNARIDMLKGIGPVIYPKDADALRKKYASDIATSRAETDAVNSSTTADDLDGMSREDYDAGSEKHLAEQMKRDAVSTAAFKGMEALDWTQKYQSKRYNDSFGGNFGASFSKGQLELELDLAYGDYLKDPSDANRDYIRSLETLLDQYQTNNAHHLAKGAAFRRLIGAGVDEESARKAAKDEAVIAALTELGGTALGEATDKWIDASKSRILSKALRDIGVEIASNSYLDRVSKANVERSLFGGADDGAWDLFLRGFMSD